MEQQQQNQYNHQPHLNNVEEWLTNTVKLPQYCNNFKNNGYESMDFVKIIHNGEMLNEIGIKKQLLGIKINYCMKLINGKIILIHHHQIH